MNMEELNKAYLGTGIVLAVLLIVSEILGCSKCFSANSITQFFITKLLCSTNTQPTEVKTEVIPVDSSTPQMQEMPS
jgi:hypothetical protein